MDYRVLRRECRWYVMKRDPHPPAEDDAFTNIVAPVLSAPYDVIKKRVEEDRKLIEANPSRP
jgi:hypothetical protein